MPDYKGYSGGSLRLLQDNGISVGDQVRIAADGEYSGIVMPRYEHSDGSHVTIKLENGYNVGLAVSRISSIRKTDMPSMTHAEEAPAEKRAGLPKVLLLSTGGTIASRVDYRTGAVTPVLTAEQLNASVPELASIAEIDARMLFSEYSENMTPANWLRIAEEIAGEADSEYAGVIVAHGTDTMHYTSSFLSFALAGFPRPIVMVGAQRSSDRASSDAALNIIGAARLAARCSQPGVYVAMHQDSNDGAIACHAGTRVRKNHTSRRDAFETIGGKPAFVVTGESIMRNMQGGYYQTEGFWPRIRLDERVALVKYHPGYDPAWVDRMTDGKYRGIIFEGTGLGHVGNTMYDAIGRAAESGIFLGMTSQCIRGRVRMTVYESGRDLLDLGITPLDDMIPEVALVKAMWAAGCTRDAESMRGVMLEKVASEASF